MSRLEYSMSYDSMIARSISTIVMLIAVIGVSCLSLNSVSQIRERGHTLDLKLCAQADSLRKYGALILSSYGEDRDEYEKLFFKYFPSTFGRFDSLYGYKQISIDSFDFMPLYGSNHIGRVFAQMKSIDDTSYYRKLISVSIGGHWAADEVGELQHLLIDRVRSNLDLTVHLLRPLNQVKIREFWLFFFDMENPSAVDFSFLKNVKDKRIIRLMKEAMKIDRTKWSNE